MPGLGYSEMMLFGIIALMLFGSKLPEVARSLGGTYRELRKNMNEFQREFHGLGQVDSPPPRPTYTEEEQTDATTNAPRFTPPSDDPK
ncbi:MAG: twin-arginine translocase TatA/TatE family subunit [Pirellulaceae bacterium]|nr:twin-arginine translocase TatA/TatE family subunit [Pirellulaceae bacterium]